MGDGLVRGFFVLACGVTLTGPVRGLDVEAEVEAVWPAAALPAELLEGLARAGQGTAYLTSIAKENISDEVEWRRVVAKIASELLCCGDTAPFARFLSLAARHGVASSRVEAVRELERAHRRSLQEPNGCPVGTPWFALSTVSSAPEAVCADEQWKVQDLLDKIAAYEAARSKESNAPASDSGGGAMGRSPLDHVLSEASSEATFVIDVIGYADLGDPTAATRVLRGLLAAAEASSPVRVAYRHGTPARLEPARLVGYGVELLSRSADEVMKAAEGENASSAATDASGERSCSLGGVGASAPAAIDPAGHFAGIHLEVLAKQQSAALRPALCAMQADLRIAAEAPLKPWIMKRLGAYASMRVVQAAAGPGGALEGLRALEEVAQDFPSGWGHALAASGESPDEEAKGRTIMKQADRMPKSGGFEINGWSVPEARRSPLALLHTFAPLFRGAELLGQAGFDQRATLELLRDSRPREELPDRFVSGDPRLAGSTGSRPIYDVMTDPAAERLRAEGSRGRPLLTLAQYYGHMLSWPPPTPRQLSCVSLVIDPCKSAHVNLVSRLMSNPLPIVAVVQVLASSDSDAKVLATRKKAVGLVRAALNALLEHGHPVPAREMLSAFAKRGSCDSDKIEEDFNKMWKDYHSQDVNNLPETITPMMDETSGQAVARLPVPSVLVNGQLVEKPDSEDGLDGFSEVIEKKLEESVGRLVEMMRWGQMGIDVSDEDIAKHQYDAKSSTPKLLQAWYPGLVPSSGFNVMRYAALLPKDLQQLPGSFRKAPDAADPKVSAHVLLLSAAGSEEAQSLATAVAFLSAYAELEAAQSAEDPLTRWLGVVVAGSCTGDEVKVGAPLRFGGALRRCLGAALGNGGLHLGNSLASLVSALAEVAGETTPSAGTLLEACERQAKKEPKAWQAPTRLGEISKAAPTVAAEDATACADQRGALQALAPLPPVDSAVIALNGRRFGPLQPIESGLAFGAAHLQLAEALEIDSGYALRGPTARKFSGETSGMASVVRALRAATGDQDPLKLAYGLAVRAKAVEEMQAARRGGDDDSDDGKSSGPEEESELEPAPTEEAVQKAPEELRIHLQPSSGAVSAFRVFVVMDPLGDEAQRLPPMLRLLHEELNAEVVIALRPKPLVEPPLIKYYRSSAVAPAPGGGGLADLGTGEVTPPGVRFSIPARRGLMLSMQLRGPEAWMISAADSGGADLDSLKAEQGGVVRAKYKLEALFVEGQATDDSGRFRRPAAGFQLSLRPLGGAAFAKGARGTAGADSVVVKSGYFQLRGPPGLYKLTLGGGSEDSMLVKPTAPIALTELIGYGRFLRANVAGKPANFEEAESKEDKLAYEGDGGDRSACDETIHIFSVASGHRYERLLRIMILSVRRHTKCPLRLWLVDNFLSPNFRQILPALGKKVGFAVSRVTYKWPAWLRVQTQKQRVIWAYKILFLDVLFPTQVQRVLFVDADQIVRADVREVWSMKLDRSVYGMVPFCGSGKQSSTSTLLSMLGSKPEDLRNPETVGFRFWEQGFWERHLGSRYTYHISALFVVNLAKFRQTGAGDILREVYQSLTNDPNSLANLDQDLPNYVQDQLPIFSLPQEWLWCESWCSNSSKAKAKTIDMCQNPVRKEGKLQQARRIAPEWAEYDSQLEAWVKEIENRDT